VVGGVDEVRVVQIVHGQHQRHTVGSQDPHDVAQHLGRGGVEAEVHVQHVDRINLTDQIIRLEHARRPPLSRQRRTRRHRIMQQCNIFGVSHGVDIRMPRRN
jgi:hypothetical protein